jgi:hypothetical protein
MDGGERFAAAARAFCLWAEAPAGEASRDIRRALELLSELYAAALGIPPSSTEGDEPTSRIDETAWSRVQDRFAALPFQWYSEAADPLEVPAEETAVGDLAEDLAEIYEDVSEGLRLFDAGREGEAARTWGLFFSSHWGRHAASAIRAIHEWISEDPRRE